MNVDLLRERLHSALDEVLDSCLVEDLRHGLVQMELERFRLHDPAITRVRIGDPFDYKWPDAYVERFSDVEHFEIDSVRGRLPVALGWTDRFAWGRIRARAVVFHTRHDPSPQRWYPWVEFVESDSDNFCAPVPDPHRPRAVLRDVASISDQYAQWPVERADELFRSIRLGPSLRAVLERDDAEGMILFAFHVARDRGRI